MVTHLLGLRTAPKPDDVSDALALALAFVNIAQARRSCKRRLMFSRITGSLIERSGDRAIVEAAGLGYEIMLPPCVADKIPPAPNGPLTLEIYAVLNVEGNSGRFTYYGFTNAIEREFFEALITVASIGPRSAARAFSQPMSPSGDSEERGKRNRSD